MRATLKLASLAGRIGSLAYLSDLAQQDLAELGEMPEASDAIGPEIQTMTKLLRDMNLSLYALSVERMQAADIIRGSSRG